MSFKKLIASDIREVAGQARTDLRLFAAECAAVASEVRADMREKCQEASAEFRAAVSEMRDETQTLSREFCHGSQQAYETIRAAARMGIVTRTDSRGTYVLLKGEEQSIKVERLHDLPVKRGTRVFVVRTASGADVACPTSAGREKLEWLVAAVFNTTRGV